MSSPLRTVVAALVVVTLVRAPEVRADDHPTQWYGWQTLAVYGGDLALVVALSQLHGNRGSRVTQLAAAASFGVYALAGPAVHVAHGRWKTAAASFGLDAAVPGIAAYAGWMSCDGSSNRFSLACAALIGGLAWTVGATIDVAVLAREDAPVAAPTARVPPARSARAVPVRLGFAF